MGNNRSASALLECPLCGRTYARIKNAMRTCGAVSKGIVCGGELKAVEKQQRPAEKTK